MKTLFYRVDIVDFGATSRQTNVTLSTPVHRSRDHLKQKKKCHVTSPSANQNPGTIEVKGFMV